MEKIFAVIKNSIVINKIVAEDGFVPDVSYDSIMDVTEAPRCEIGDSYDGEAFQAPVTGVSDAPVSDFSSDPITLSSDSNSMEVSITNDVITVGCMNFNVVWAKTHLIQFLQENLSYKDTVQATRLGLVVGDKVVVWDDAQLILDYIISAGV